MAGSPAKLNASSRRRVYEEIVPLTAAEIQETWSDVCRGEDLCRGIVEDIVAATEPDIVQAHLDDQCIPWTVQGVLTDLIESLGLAFVDREVECGDAVAFDEAAVTELHIDTRMTVPEPPLVPADSWCRASIQQRRRITKPKSEEPETPHDDDRAIGAARHAATFRRSLAGSSANATDPAAKSSALKSSADVAASATNVAKPSKARARLPSTTEAPKDGDTVDDSHDAEAGSVLAALHEHMNRMKQLRTISDSVSKQLATVKPGAQSFVVDGTTHTVVQVQSLDGKSLPPSRAEMKFSEVDAVDQDDGSVAPQAIKKPERAEPKRKPKKEDASSFWQPERTTNPMISDVPPAAGVTHRMGDVVRHADLKPPRTRLSRSEFNKMLALQQTTTSAIAATDELGAPPAVTVPKGDAGAVSNDRAPASDTATDPPKAEAANEKATPQSKKAPAPSLARARISTPNMIKRPSSETSGAVRHPTGGVQHPNRSIARVSTPTPYVKREITLSRPGSQQSPVRPARQAPLPEMRIADTDDETARDFLVSLHEDGEG